MARLATRSPDGAPHLVPVTFALTGKSLVTAVDWKPKRSTALRRLANVRADPRVTVLIDHYDSDWSKLWWVRLHGDGRVVEPGAPEHELAIAALVDKYPQYQGRAPEGPALVVTVTGWRWWSAAGPG